jgi:PAS domain S-box-containing protein
MEQIKRCDASQTEDDRYRMLIDAISDYAIYMLDPDGIITSWNPGARRFKGYDEHEILGQHFSRFYLEEDRAAGIPQFALETAARDGKFESEGWRVRKDGSKFWAFVVIDPIRGSRGEIIGFAKITRDLTERRLAEERLRQSEEQFRILVQGVVDYAIFLLKPDGTVASWNAGAQRIKGYLPHEIIGQHFSRFYSAEDQNEGLPRKALEIATQTGRTEKEGWRVRKDGSRFWAHVVIDAIRNADGTLLGFAKITRDITERREADEELERTREALFQSQKMEAIGQLTGWIAHDFNNLLMAIMASLELLQRRLPDGDPNRTRFLENAMQAAKRGASLTQRMLAFARKQDLKPVAVDVANLIHGMTELLQSSLGPSVQIEPRFPLTLPSVSADPNQMELAILNLAVNARDAMQSGGSITIAANEKSAESIGLSKGRYVCISVVDTGDGMDRSTLLRAMEPFFTTKGIGKGTGLGLSMVHGMMQQLGGKLVLRSRKGEGTTAELWLPVATAVPTIEKWTSNDRPTIGPSRVILSVDDDSLVSLNTVAMLEELGHKVFEASSGKQALNILRHEADIDLLITDQAMPGMTGTELADAVRLERPDLPVIIATGYDELPENADTKLL